MAVDKNSGGEHRQQQRQPKDQEQFLAYARQDKSQQRRGLTPYQAMLGVSRTGVTDSGAGVEPR